MGKEIVQLYIGHAQDDFYAPKELKGFEKVELAPGQSKQVTFQLDERTFAYYDVEKQDWVIASGEYQILIGASSRDIRLSGTVLIESGYVVRKDKNNSRFFYASLKNNHFTEAAFQTLYGKVLPQEHAPSRGDITLNTSLLDFRKTLFGRLVVAILKREFTKQSVSGYDALHEQMVEKIMLEIPLQNLINLSDGHLTEKTAKALVQLANGRLLAALRSLRS